MINPDIYLIQKALSAWNSVKVEDILHSKHLPAVARAQIQFLQDGFMAVMMIGYKFSFKDRTDNNNLVCDPSYKAPVTTLEEFVTEYPERFDSRLNLSICLDAIKVVQDAVKPPAGSQRATAPYTPGKQYRYYGAGAGHMLFFKSFESIKDGDLVGFEDDIGIVSTAATKVHGLENGDLVTFLAMKKIDWLTRAQVIHNGQTGWIPVSDDGEDFLFEKEEP